MYEHKKRQRAFRVAFDYLEQQAVKVDGYTDAADYFRQAWEELLKLSDAAENVLGKDLLIRAYEELERIWQAKHSIAAG